MTSLFILHRFIISDIFYYIVPFDRMHISATSVGLIFQDVVSFFIDMHRS